MFPTVAGRCERAVATGTPAAAETAGVSRLCRVSRDGSAGLKWFNGLRSLLSTAEREVLCYDADLGRQPALAGLVMPAGGSQLGTQT